MQKILIRLATFILLIAAIGWALLNRDSLDMGQLQGQLEQAGAIAPLIFMLVYILSTVLFLPGSILTLLGGAIFGPVLGTVYSLTAATLGAMISFLIARYLASDWVEKKAGGRIQQLIQGVNHEGWRFVAFTRLMPLFPFNLLNYALGLTRIRFSHYAIATYIFMLPGAIAYTYLGYIGREMAAGGEALVQKIMLGLALLGLVAFLPRIINSIRRADMLDIEELKQRLDSHEDLLLLDVRSESDYHGEQGHIAQSTLLPLEQLSERLDELEAWRDRPIITICRTDRRSSQAARLLANLGFSQVKVARMGMTDWISHHYPVEN